MKKSLSVARAVEAAHILVELNSGRESVLAMAERAGLLGPGGAGGEAIVREWRAFARAAVLYGLMAQAPAVTVVEFLRGTREALTREGYSPAEAEVFVDGEFRAYVDPLLREKPGECPAVFFQRLRGDTLSAAASTGPHAVAVVSGVMAMVLAAILDKLEQYEFLAE